LFNQINAALVRLSIDHTYMDHNLIFFLFLICHFRFICTTDRTSLRQIWSLLF